MRPTRPSHEPSAPGETTNERATAGPAIEALVARAVDGDPTALDQVLRAIQRDVYNLAVRMLWCPDDAADATQEILMRVVTRLATFRGESAFRTWVFRVATNHLLNVRKSRVEREEHTFASFGAALGEGLAEPPARAADGPDQALLEEEVKIGCTQGMLLCLDRDHRAAYVLGEVFELSGEEAAQVLEITPAAFRKRFSRARERLRAFMSGHCGLVNPDAPCRCARRISHAVSVGIVRPGTLLFAAPERAAAERAPVLAAVDEMTTLYRIAGIYRSHPTYPVPAHALAGIRRTLREGGYALLRES
jgi:RNA polymerase sigma factor (sigma-70 family)